MIRSVILLGAVLVLLLFSVAACKEATLGPDQFGSIEGQVLDFETDTPIARASISTSPATSAIVTDDDGRFHFDEIEAGSYTITAGRPGYIEQTVNVRVRHNQTAQAIILLEPEGEEPDE